MSQLPLFEGHQPQGAQLTLTGTITNGVARLVLDQEVRLVVTGRVTGVNHKLVGKEDVLVRIHTVTVTDAHAIDPTTGELS